MFIFDSKLDVEVMKKS